MVSPTKPVYVLPLILLFVNPAPPVIFILIQPVPPAHGAGIATLPKVNTGLRLTIVITLESEHIPLEPTKTVYVPAFKPENTLPDKGLLGLIESV